MRKYSFLFVALLLSCGSEDNTDDFRIHNPHDGIWQDAAAVPFRFVLEQTFGAEEEPLEEMLGGIIDVAADDEGNVYIIDNQQNRLVSFDAEGQFRWSAGREGEGPGEFSRPRSVLWDGAEMLYVENQASGRIEQFTVDGEFVDAVPGERMGLTRASLVDILDGERLVVSESMAGRAGVVVHTISPNNEWEKLATVEYDRGDELQMEGQPVSYAPYAGVVDGEIAIAHVSEYAFDFYSPEAELTRVVSRDVEDFVRPGLASSGSGYTVRIYSSLDAPIELANGYRLVRAGWPEGVRDPDEYLRTELAQNSFENLITFRTIDLYDSDWRLLYAWTVRDAAHEGIGTFYRTDSDGKLYARVPGDFPMVGRYRVEIDRR